MASQPNSENENNLNGPLLNINRRTMQWCRIGKHCICSVFNFIGKLTIAIRKAVFKVIKFLNEYNGAFTAAATLAIAGLTVDLAIDAREQRIIFQNQLNVMQGQLNQSELSSQSQLRAYVISKQERLVKVASNGHISVDLVNKNFGQTPAYDVIQTGCIAVLPYPNIAKIHCSEGPFASREFMAPTAESIIPIHMHRPITTEEIKAVQNGQMAIYLVGHISYRDAFGKQWITNLRYSTNGEVFDGKEHPMSTEPDGNSEQPDKNNNAPLNTAAP